MARTEPIRLLGDRTLDDVVEYALPIVVATVCVLSLGLTLNRVSLLAGWSDDYAGAGSFVVEGCEESGGLGADQWRCGGTLFADGAPTPASSTLVTSSGALVSDRPYVGQEFEVFHRTGEESVVYPDADRLNELTRLYFSLLPRVLLFGGATIWLVGWWATRRVRDQDPVERQSIRFPGRFAWRSRGATWMIVGLAVAVGNLLLVNRVIGSLGIA